MTTAGPPPRRGVFVAEVAALVAATAVDTVLALRLDRPVGITATVLTTVVPYLGPAFAVLAVLRRRLPRGVDRLAAVVVGLSLLNTGFHAINDVAGLELPDQSVATEVYAVVLLVGAGCRRSRRGHAVLLAGAAGLAVVLAPVVRYGIDSTAALLAAPAALLWGVALAVGLVLRDADTRHATALREARTHERLRLARDLHDLVAHYVSGIVVRAQAARSLAGNPAAPAQDPAEVYGEIEEAGAEALTAMRELVGMLRASEHLVPAAGAVLSEVVRDAAGRHAGVVVEVPDELDDLPVSPDLAATLHGVVLESLTNARRHAPHTTGARVVLTITGGQMELDVSNALPERGDAGDDRSTGYGIIGMTERVSALGGTLDVGPAPDGRWHTTARLPLDPSAQPARGV
jgi:signal transduction histidine kinase